MGLASCSVVLCSVTKLTNVVAKLAYGVIDSLLQLLDYMLVKKRSNLRCLD